MDGGVRMKRRNKGYVCGLHRAFEECCKKCEFKEKCAIYDSLKRLKGWE